MNVNENQTFEESMKRLDEIVNKLDGGDASLDEDLALFAEGASLVEKCNGMLDSAEIKVKKLVSDMNGKTTEEDFTENGEGK